MDELFEEDYPFWVSLAFLLLPNKDLEGQIVVAGLPVMKMLVKLVMYPSFEHHHHRVCFWICSEKHLCFVFDECLCL